MSLCEDKALPHCMQCMQLHACNTCLVSLLCSYSHFPSPAIAIRYHWSTWPHATHLISSQLDISHASSGAIFASRLYDYTTMDMTWKWSMLDQDLNAHWMHPVLVLSLFSILADVYLIAFIPYSCLYIHALSESSIAVKFLLIWDEHQHVHSEAELRYNRTWKSLGPARYETHASILVGEHTDPTIFLWLARVLSYHNNCKKNLELMAGQSSCTAYEVLNIQASSIHWKPYTCQHVCAWTHFIPCALACLLNDVSVSKNKTYRISCTCIQVYMMPFM